mgnify:CR=1 FL=1
MTGTISPEGKIGYIGGIFGKVIGSINTVGINPRLSEPQGPGTSKLDWRYFEDNKVDRNELQVRKSLHKGTGTKMIYFFLSNCSIFQPFLFLCLFVNF